MARTNRFGSGYNHHLPGGTTKANAARTSPATATHAMANIWPLLDATDTRETITMLAGTLALKPEYVANAFTRLADTPLDDATLPYCQALKTSIPINGEDHGVMFDAMARKLASLYLDSLKPVPKTFRTTGRDELIQHVTNMYQELYERQIKYGEIKLENGETKEAVAANNAREAIRDILKQVSGTVRKELNQQHKIARDVRRLDITDAPEPDPEDYAELATAAPNESWIECGESAQDPSVLLGDYEGRETAPVKPKPVTTKIALE